MIAVRPRTSAHIAGSTSRWVAAAGAAEQPEHLGWLQTQVDGVQHRVARLVAEGDALELYGKGTFGQQRPARVRYARLDVEEGADAGDAGAGVLELLHLLADLV